MLHLVEDKKIEMEKTVWRKPLSASEIILRDVREKTPPPPKKQAERFQAYA
jgi:hypothetical protein